jgi:hypothetical protein
MMMAVLPAVALAQQKPETAGDDAARGPSGHSTPLKVQVVVTKLQGDRKVGSLPYSFTCNSEGPPTRLRMGIEVPIATKTSEHTASFQYRNVGTNIDCRARSVGQGRFHLELTVEQSSIYSSPGASGGGDGASQVRPAAAASLESAPLFRTFNAHFAAVLRDGQQAEYTSATDPVSGEVMKIDVSLAVLR